MSERIEDWIESLVEELFQYYDDIDCAVTVDQRITAKEQAELWLKRLLTQLEAERDEAVRRAVEGERERLAMWAHNNPKDTVEGHDMCIDFNELIEALTPQTSDISSEGNSKQYE